MNKSANLSIRIDPKLKEEAEEILNSLGIGMSSAISIFLKQVTLHNGLPFDVKIPDPITFCEDLTDEELLQLLNDAKEGKDIPFEVLKKKYLGKNKWYIASL